MKNKLKKKPGEKLLVKNSKNPYYKVTSTYSRVECLRLAISPESGFRKGQEVAQIKLDNGALLIVPVEGNDFGEYFQEEIK